MRPFVRSALPVPTNILRRPKAFPDFLVRQTFGWTGMGEERHAAKSPDARIAFASDRCDALRRQVNPMQAKLGIKITRASHGMNDPSPNAFGLRENHNVASGPGSVNGL